MRTGAPGIPAIALVSLHPSGIVREKAVSWIAATPVPELMPFLVLRTTDWARQVSDPARAAFALLLHANPTSLLPASVGMALRLEDRSRSSFARSQLRVALSEAPVRLGAHLLNSPDRPGRLVPLLRDESATVIREATGVLLPAARSLPLDLPCGLLIEGDRPVVRAAGYRLLRRHDRTVWLRAAEILARDDPWPKLAARGAADLRSAYRPR
ncbi:hypothetical protein [Amycolatopsis aidingensis]|uniref:hypothetical protein n=1 Tax=Amycolatopsis aidingensis TaxID=2842453 RepID=UPI001C0C8055|nr:hypothetical protein [Amycolatopsis aidingensis]